MNGINYKDYKPSMGTIIDLEDEIVYKRKHLPNSINIPYEKLLYNHKKLLDKNQLYFLTCAKGVKSKRMCNILKYNGYNVTQLFNE